MDSSQLWARQSLLSTVPHHVSPPPCFFWKACSARAALDKAGRSVCRRCASRLRGAEYPLRAPSAQPIYLTSHAAAESLDMVELDPVE